MRKICLVAVILPLALCLTQCRSLKKASVSDVTAIAAASDSISSLCDSVVGFRASMREEELSITAGRRGRIEFHDTGGEVYVGADGALVLRGVDSAEMENIEVSVGSRIGSEREEKVEIHSAQRSAGSSEVYVERDEKESSEPHSAQTVFGLWPALAVFAAVFFIMVCIWRRLRR